MRIETKKSAKRPARLGGRGAFIVHGHRLSSLYRVFTEQRNGYQFAKFIVPKILELRAHGYIACGASISGTMKRGAS